jgi:hypothetical protein
VFRRLIHCANRDGNISDSVQLEIKQSAKTAADARSNMLYGHFNSLAWSKEFRLRVLMAPLHRSDVCVCSIHWSQYMRALQADEAFFPKCAVPVA